MSNPPLVRRIFLSHAWEGDAPHPDVLRLLKAVGIEAGPRSPGWIPAQRTFAVTGGRAVQLEVFFDKPSIHVGADLTKVIQKHLGEAHLLAAAWSERYPTRAACMWEYRKAFFAGGRREPPDHRVRAWPLYKDPAQDEGEAQARVMGSIRPRPEVKGELLPNLATSDPVEVWQGLAEEAAAKKTPIPLTHKGPLYLHGVGLADYSRFVGRGEELWRIYDALHAPGNSGRAQVAGTGTEADPARQGLVQGLGGIGKSLLAQVYAHRFAGAYPGGIVWLEALGHNDAGANLSGAERHQERRRQLREVARSKALGLKLPDDADGGEITRRLKAALETRGLYLWIVDDYPSRPAVGERIEQWLAPTENGRSLVTSRSRVALGIGTEIALGVLPPGATAPWPPSPETTLRRPPSQRALRARRGSTSCPSP